LINITCRWQQVRAQRPTIAIAGVHSGQTIGERAQRRERGIEFVPGQHQQFDLCLLADRIDREHAAIVADLLGAEWRLSVQLMTHHLAQLLGGRSRQQEAAAQHLPSRQQQPAFAFAARLAEGSVDCGRQLHISLVREMFANRTLVIEVGKGQARQQGLVHAFFQPHFQHRRTRRADARFIEHARVPGREHCTPARWQQCSELAAPPAQKPR
jgi:molybdate-binding protein